MWYHRADFEGNEQRVDTESSLISEKQSEVSIAISESWPLVPQLS